jgi:hypothetical protein
MTFWDSILVDAEVNFCSNNWILSVLLCRETRIKVYIINIYMPIRYMGKMGCWNSLFVAKDSLDLPSCIVASDFNTILYNSEKKGGSCVHDPICEMEDLILDWELSDVKPMKGKYTWSNKRSNPGQIVVRLDRFLIHNNFFLYSLSITSKIIPSVLSNHKPIILSLEPP